MTSSGTLRVSRRSVRPTSAGLSRIANVTFLVFGDVFKQPPCAFARMSCGDRRT
jgi:hypothetical protein